MTAPRGAPEAAGPSDGTASRWLRPHVGAYALGAAILLLAAILLSNGGLAFWPLLVWGIFLMLHVLYVRSLRTDERWADERALELADKAYDFSHIESIRDRYAGADAPGRRRDREVRRALSGRSDEGQA